MIDSFDVKFKCVAAVGYWFEVKNPRDPTEFYDAAAAFADRIKDHAYKSFEWGAIENMFINPKMLGRSQTFVGSHCQGEDLKFLKMSVSTNSYLKYRVDYEIFVGYPFASFRDAVGE